MFYALATQQDWMKDNLFTAALLDPCTISLTEGTHIYEDGLFHFEEYGVYVMGGPNRDQDIATICDNFDDEICQWFSDYSYGEPVSVQTQIHWA